MSSDIGSIPDPKCLRLQFHTHSIWNTWTDCGWAEHCGPTTQIMG